MNNDISDNSDNIDLLSTRQEMPTDPLLQHQDRYRLLIESAIDYAIFFMDVQGVIVDWNSGAKRITGYSAEEIIGQPGAIIFTPEDREKGAPERELNTARTQGRAVNERWHVRKDGSYFWGSGIVMPLQDHEGTWIGFSKVMRDHTERKQAEQMQAQLLEREQKAKREAEAANQSKDEFIAILAHELRTPLNIVLGWTDLLRQDLDPETKQRALDTIQRSTNAQKQLINDLLDVSRINSGTLRIEMTDVDLMLLVSTAIESAKPSAQAKSLLIQAVFDSDIGYIRGDPDRLQQVVANLLNNAIKFTPSGGHIEVHLQKDDAACTIRVNDTGDGIDPQFLPHVFDRYRQGNLSRAHQQSGLGLGLAIVKQLVELHGGTIEAQSEGAGKGASFTVRLPLQHLSS